MELQETDNIKAVILDVIEELRGEGRKRPQGVGITSERYVEDELLGLVSYLGELSASEGEMHFLTQKRNKLNREITTLKKASLNN